MRKLGKLQGFINGIPNYFVANAARRAATFDAQHFVAVQTALLPLGQTKIAAHIAQCKQQQEEKNVY